MITTVSIENAHLYGDIIPSIYKLRYQGFKIRQDYNVPSYKGMEYDEYDTPVATYLAWRDDDGIVRGCTRLFPTTYPYMIEDLWPECVQSVPLPKSNKIWEATRFCIDNSLPVDMRKRIHGELLCAFQEFGLRSNISWMIGVMPSLIWRSVFIRAGWPIEFLGPEMEPEPKDRFICGKMKISKRILSSVREKFSIHEPVLQYEPTYKPLKTA